MPPDVGGTAVAEASPSVDPSSSAGLGATEAVVERPKAETVDPEIFRRMQQRLDRAEAQAARAQQEAAQAFQRLDADQTNLQWQQWEAGQPDRSLTPEENAQYWRQRAFEAKQQQYQEQSRAREEAQQREQNATAQQRADGWVAEQLAAFRGKTGLTVEPNDARLILLQGVPWKVGTDAFLKSLSAIEREAKALERAKIEALKEAGIDRFDGGAPNGGATQRSGFTLEQISDPKFYKAHEAEIMADLETRGLFGAGRRRAS